MTKGEYGKGYYGNLIRKLLQYYFIKSLIFVYYLILIYKQIISNLYWMKKNVSVAESYNNYLILNLNIHLKGI